MINIVLMFFEYEGHMIVSSKKVIRLCLALLLLMLHIHHEIQKCLKEDIKKQLQQMRQQECFIHIAYDHLNHVPITLVIENKAWSLSHNAEMLSALQISQSWSDPCSFIIQFNDVSQNHSILFVFNHVQCGDPKSIRYQS